MLLDPASVGLATVSRLRQDVRRHGRVNSQLVPKSEPRAEDDTELTFERIDLKGVDRALSFHWRVPREALLRAGWQPSGDRLRDRAFCSIVADLVLGAADHMWSSYSRTKDFYRSQTRYQGLPYTYAYVTGIVEELLELGWIEEERANTRCRGRRQSRIRATMKLLELFRGVQLEYDVPECVVMRQDGRPIGYQDNRFTRRRRKRLQRINKVYEGVTISFPTINGLVDTGTHIHIGEQTIRKSPRPYLQAIFVRGDWKCGGRLYAWYQCLPKAIRAQMLIDGEETVEFDYSATHPSMLYAIEGIKLDFDPYLPPEADVSLRDLYKFAFNTAINAGTRHETIWALLKKKFSKGKRAGFRWSDFFDYHETAEVIDQLIRHNRPIAKYIASDAGIKLQAQDSEIALRVVERCLDRGFTVLPVHDSFIAQKKHAEALQQVMAEVMDEWKKEARGLDLDISIVEGKTAISAESETSEVSENAQESCSHDRHMIPGPSPRSPAPAPVFAPLPEAMWSSECPFMTVEEFAAYEEKLRNAPAQTPEQVMPKSEAFKLLRIIRNQQSAVPILEGQLRDLAVMEMKISNRGKVSSDEARFIMAMLSGNNGIWFFYSDMQPSFGEYKSRTQSLWLYPPPRWREAMRASMVATCARIAGTTRPGAYLH